MNSNYILITGASSGIGKEMAIYFSQYHNIILNGRDIQKLEIVKSLCHESYKHKIWVYDLNNIHELENSLVQFIKVDNIKVESFVHCAGFMKMTPLKMQSLQMLEMTFNTNVVSASIITKVLSNFKMNSNILRSVVFISSNLSNRGGKALSAYGASKGAIDTFMRCLAVELAPKVRLNSILPGAIFTEMTKNIFENEEVVNRMIGAYPLGLGEPLDICYLAEFLLSDKAKWITGQQITVDGGRSINISV